MGFNYDVWTAEEMFDNVLRLLTSLPADVSFPIVQIQAHYFLEYFNLKLLATDVVSKAQWLTLTVGLRNGPALINAYKKWLTQPFHEGKDVHHSSYPRVLMLVSSACDYSIFWSLVDLIEQVCNSTYHF